MNEELNKLGISLTEQNELKRINKFNKRSIKKIVKGIPIQHIIGYVDFYGYKIKVNKNVLIPRYETELLVEKTINYLKKYNFNKITVLDLCTGSGCISVALQKELCCLSVLASDISQKALNVAKNNFKINNCDINVKRSDLFRKINGKYDLIITNPPYLPLDEQISEQVKHDPFISLFSGKKGLDHIEEIIKNCNKYLNNKSILAMEIHSTQKKRIIKLLNIYFPGNKYSFEKDLTGRIRYLFILKNCE